MPASKQSRVSFEDLYRQLEEKVGLLEQGGLSLDDSLAAYEEAVSLAQRCQQLLDGAELRITRLRQSLDGSAEAAPEEDEPPFEALQEEEA